MELTLAAPAFPAPRLAPRTTEPARKQQRRKHKKKKKKKKVHTAITKPAVVVRETAAQAATRESIAHLLRRTTFGPTPAMMATATAAGWSNWLDEQLTPSSLSDPGGNTVRSIFPELGWDIPTTRDSIEEFGWAAMFALGQATIALAIWSERQLFEVMVEFWSNHLNVTNPHDAGWDNRPDYDRTVIRAHALGNFSDMLVASSRHPAMLQYLNNASSTKNDPNENYGRELMELHTLGVDAGYDEADVLTSARIMTGWTVDDSTGLAIYKPRRHYTGRVSVFGFTDSNASQSGQAVAEDYLRHLATRPETARRIASKLCERFVSDAPPASLVGTLAATYLRGHTDIKPVLRQLFHSAEFWESKGSKVRRPYEDMIATMRTMGHQLLPASKSQDRRRSGARSLYWMAQSMRQPPLGWGLPTGYPDIAAHWMSADVALSKLNMHRSIAESWWPGGDELAIVQPKSLLPKIRPATYGALVDQMSMRLVYRVLPTTQRTAVLAFFGKSASTKLNASDEILTWRVGALVTLILNTPAHGIR